MATDLYKGVDAQADLARKRANQVERSNVTQQKDAMARRAAQLGGGPSGALIKQDSLAENASAERLQAANEGIEAARMGEHSRIGQVLQGQEFAKGERLGSQAFATGERMGSQAFATGERLGTQSWQSGEAGKQRTWQTGERVSGQKWQSGEAAVARKAAVDAQVRQIEAAAAEGKLNRDQANAQLAEVKRQYDIDTQHNETTNRINTILSANNSGLKPEVIGQLLASLGIDIGPIEGLTAAKPAAPTTGSGANAMPAGFSKFMNGKVAPNGYGFDSSGRLVRLEE